MATGLENLKVYKMAEDLEISVHKITKDFPDDEKFRSIDQLRRSSASVANNIAEGYNRYSYQEKIHYLIIAKSEAEETKRNILKSAKKEFMDTDLAEKMADQYTELIKAISGYVRFIRETKTKNSRT